MRNQKSVRVIFDTNVWISFLIGKRLGFIKHYLADRSIKIIFSGQLIEELTLITKHPKFSKYFPEEKVNELIILMNAIGENVSFASKHHFVKDPRTVSFLT